MGTTAPFTIHYVDDADDITSHDILDFFKLLLKDEIKTLEKF